MPLSGSQLRIDTTVGAAAGPSSTGLSSSRTGGITPGSSTTNTRSLRSAKSAGRLRAASSASTSSSTSNPAYALDNATNLNTMMHTHAPHASLSLSEPFTDRSSSGDEQDAFTYVLAMHDYTPPAVAHNAAATCLAFRAGQIIRLYNRDSSGWWDGEVDGRRGWFPSNYVTADTEALEMLKDEELPRVTSRNGHAHTMSTSSAASWASSVSSLHAPNRTDHRPIPSTSSMTSTASASTNTSMSSNYCPPLMLPLLHALSLLSNTIKEQRMAHLQPSTACIISCVRTILSQVGCLQREADILKRYAALARERKRILGDLCGLVECAKGAVLGTSGEAEGMLKLAGELFAHVRSFLAIAVQCGADVRPPSSASHARRGSEGASGKGSVEGRWDSQEGTLVRSEGEEAQDEYPGWKSKAHATHAEIGPRQREVTVTPNGHMRAKSLSDLKARARPGKEEVVPDLPQPPDKVSMQSMGLTAGKQWKAPQGTPRRFTSAPIAHSTHSSVSSISSASSAFSSSSGSSASSTGTPPTSSALPTGSVSTAALLHVLRHTHDTYLSTIAAFIGHAHSHSRTSHASSTGHMYDLVREVVEAVCRLLTIVEAVLRNEAVPPAKKQELRRAKEGLYAVTSTLADAVRRLTTNSGSGGRESEVDSEEASEEDEKAALLRCATNALKAGADCVSAVKKCLQRATGEQPFVIILPEPGKGPGGDGPDGDGVYLYTPSKFSHQRQQSNRSLPRIEEPTETSHVRKPSALRELYRVNGIEGDGDDEDLTIHAQTVSFNTDMDTPKKSDPPAVKSGESEPLQAVLSEVEPETPVETPIEPLILPSDTEDEHDVWSSPKDKPLPPLQIPDSLEPVSRPQSPLSTTSIAPTDDGTTWEGARTPQLSSQGKGELPQLPTLSMAPSAQLSRPEGLAWLLSHDHPVEDVAYNSEGQLVGATLEALVERMTPHDSLVEPAFAAVFFMTFRLLTTPSELLSALIARYNILPPVGLTDGEIFVWQQQKGLPVRLRVSNFVKIWLENHWRPSVDNVVLPELQAFARDALAVMFPMPTQRILELIQSKAASGKSDASPKMDRTRDAGIPLNPPSLPAGEVPRPIMTKAVLSALRAKNYATISVTDFDALELARQLTVMECTLYGAIPSEEVLETGQSGAAYPAVKAVTSLSTVITGWVAESILNEPDTKKRTGLVKFFIKVADRCAWHLQNFSTPRSILAALDSSTISRLHQTWSGLPQKNRVQLETLRKLADHARNYHEYRTRLRNTAPPAVPFLGLYLTDITFCREGNPSHRTSPKNPDKKLINFNKYHKLARIVQDMQRFQHPYTLKEIPEVQDYLRDAFEQSKNRTDLQDLYRRSLLVEPKRPADTPPTGDMRQLFQWATRSQPQPAPAS